MKHARVTVMGYCRLNVEGHLLSLAIVRFEAKPMAGHPGAGSGPGAAGEFILEMTTCD